MQDQQLSIKCDVAVIGGGMAGKAAALHLSNAGLNVVCIEPGDLQRAPVGESLDWSSPDLLKGLGFPMDEVINGKIGTWKKHVILKMPKGAPEDYVPVPWLAEGPFHVELKTLHVDRNRLDGDLLQKVHESPITLLQDRVSRIEKDGSHIRSVSTAAGREIISDWFVDASGFATSLFAREMELPREESGPQKVALWTYFPVEESTEGTTLYMQPEPAEYLEWIWEIPIQTRTVSVGYITTAEEMKNKRREGKSTEEIFREQLSRVPRLARLLEVNSLGELNVTTFQSRVYRHIAGPNWFIAGEAAAMVDPITSNGVTAALRHALEGTRLILKYRKRGAIPLSARACYSFRVRQVAKFFNSGIENIVYRTPVRNRLGLRHCGTIYISPAWTMNLVYARMKPKGWVSTIFLSAILGFFRASEWILFRLCQLFPSQAGVEQGC